MSAGADMLHGPGAVRWGAAGLVILALHGGALLVAAAPWEMTPPPPLPEAAVMIDLAPLPAAPPSPAPTPPQEAAPDPAPAPEPEVVEPDLPDLPPPPPVPVPDPEPLQVAPKPKPKPPAPPKPRVQTPPKPVPPKVQKPVEQPPETVPENATAQASGAPAAPTQSTAPAGPPAPAAPSSYMTTDAARSWQAEMFAHLERHRRYPRQAQLRNQQGQVTLRFSIDREGHVLASSIERPSGNALFDRETLAMMKRADPLPPPPDDIPSTELTFVVPVIFSLR